MARGNSNNHAPEETKNDGQEEDDAVAGSALQQLQAGGSGLAVFFRDHLPPPSAANNNDHDYQYETSLQEVVISQQGGGGKKKNTDQLTTYKSYRRLDRDWLSSFLSQRYQTEEQAQQQREEGGHSSEDDAYYEESEDEQEIQGQEDGEDENEDSEDEEHKFETQQEGPEVPPSPRADPPPTAESAARNAPSRRKKPRLPPLYLAENKVDNVDDLGFDTKELTLDLCRVEKVWPLRPTKRVPAIGRDVGVLLKSYKGTHRRTDMFRFPDMEEDGPLASCYSRVVSLELVLLKKKPSVQTAAPPQHPNPFRSKVDRDKSKPPDRRIRLFLYNEYAERFSDWYRQFEKIPWSDREFIMSLKQLGAINVLPFPVDDSDFWQRSTCSRYCLCIGSESLLQRRRFDDNEFELQAGVVPKSRRGQLGSLWIMTKAVLVDDDSPLQRYQNGAPLIRDEDGKEDEETIATKYRVWEQQKSQANQTVPTVRIAASAPAVVAAPADPPTTSTTSKASEKAPWDPSDDETEEEAPMPQPDGQDDDASDEGFQTPDEVEDNQENIARGPTAASRPPTYSNTINNNHREAIGQLPQVSDATPRAGQRRPLHPVIIDSPAKRRRNAPEVPYTTLNDLRRIFEASADDTDTSYNLRGVVLNVTCPKQTRRGDWMIKVSLIDDSEHRQDHELGQEPIALTVFQKDYEKLPKVRSIGDVLLCHRIKINRYNGTLSLCGMRGSAFGVFFLNEDNNGFEMVPTAKKQFTFNDIDAEKSGDLWKWGKERLFKQPTMLSKTAVTLAQLSSAGGEDSSTTNDKDMTVMITSMFPLPHIMRRNQSPCGFLRVWDGTGSSNVDPLPIDSEAALRQTRQYDPPIEAVVRLSKTVEKIQAVDESFGIAPPKSLCGRVMNVFVWEEHQWHYIQSVCKIGSFLRIRNGDYGKLFWDQAQSHCISISSNTWFGLLPEVNYEVRGIIRNHQMRINRNDPDIPTGGCLPMPGGASHPILTEAPLRGLALFAGKGEVDAVFKGKCRVVGTTPDCNQGMGQLIRFDDAKETYDYFFCVILEDEHGSAHALVANSVAMKLVGMPAAEAVMESEAQRNMLSHINQKREFNVELKLVCFTGRKHFLLQNITEA